MWYVDIQEYYLAIKHETLYFVTARAIVEDIIIRRTSYEEKGKYFFSLLRGCSWKSVLATPVTCLRATHPTCLSVSLSAHISQLGRLNLPTHPIHICQISLTHNPSWGVQSSLITCPYSSYPTYPTHPHCDTLALSLGRHKIPNANYIYLFNCRTTPLQGGALEPNNYPPL